MMDSRRFIRTIQLAVALFSIAAVAILVLAAQYAAATGVGVAGVVLLVLTVVLWRRSVLAGAEETEDRRRNLYLVLRLGHLVAAAGVLVIAVGAVLAATGAGDRELAFTMTVWVGPFALVAALGLYSAYSVQKREREREHGTATGGR